MDHTLKHITEDDQIDDLRDNILYNFSTKLLVEMQLISRAARQILGFYVSTNFGISRSRSAESSSALRSRIPSISLQALSFISGYLSPMSLAVSVPRMRSRLGRGCRWAIAQLH
jgi:hypothetical protein